MNHFIFNVINNRHNSHVYDIRTGEIIDTGTGQIINNRRRANYNLSEDYNDENINEIDCMELSLDSLISNPIINQTVDFNEEKNDKQTLAEFKKNNINRLYEEMLCYFSSPEILKKYKSSVIGENKNYIFYKDFISENFMIEQKQRIKKISELPKINQDSLIKKRKLLNYKNIFFTSPIASKITDLNKIIFIEVDNLRAAMEKYSFLCLNENDDTKILSYFKKLGEEF